MKVLTSLPFWWVALGGRVHCVFITSCKRSTKLSPGLANSAPLLSVCWRHWLVSVDLVSPARETCVSGHIACLLWASASYLRMGRTVLFFFPQDYCET